jgi:hypothetical protein
MGMLGWKYMSISPNVVLSGGNGVVVVQAGAETLVVDMTGAEVIFAKEA